jgi:hypothetical protein
MQLETAREYLDARDAKSVATDRILLSTLQIAIRRIGAGGCRSGRRSTVGCQEYDPELEKTMNPRGLAVAALAVGLGLVFPAMAGVDSNQSAAWALRQVHIVFFGTCDQTYDLLRVTLLRLGARARDLNIDERNCPAPNGAASLDATFSVLVPADGKAQSAGGAAVDAHWETVELRGNCVVIAYFTRKILPLFSTRNVKLVPRDFCEKFHIGLRADLLKPLQAPATSR